MGNNSPFSTPELVRIGLRFRPWERGYYKLEQSHPQEFIACSIFKPKYEFLFLK